MLKKTVLKYLGIKQKERLLYFNSLRHMAAYPELLKAMPENLLVLAPHPDDETIGCGGLLLKKENKNDVTVACLTDGGDFREQNREVARQLIAKRRAEFTAAMGFMGIADFELWDFPGDGLQNHREVCAKKIAAVIQQKNKSNIFAPSPFESHLDHWNVAVILQEVLKKGSVDASRVNLWFYEVWSPVTANVALDISDVMMKKLEAIQKFQSQVANVAYDKCIEGLNRYRGMVVQCDYAESFWKISGADFIARPELRGLCQ